MPPRIHDSRRSSMTCAWSAPTSITPTALTCWRQRRHADSRSRRISGSQLAISCRSRGRSRRSGSSVATTGLRTTTSPERSTCPSRSEEHTSELQSHHDLVCRLLLEKKKKKKKKQTLNKKKKKKKKNKIKLHQK